MAFNKIACKDSDFYVICTLPDFCWASPPAPDVTPPIPFSLFADLGGAKTDAKDAQMLAFFAQMMMQKEDWQTGETKFKSRCFGGRSAVRKALYMATVVATRFEPLIRDFYQRLLSKVSRIRLPLRHVCANC